MAVIFEAAYSKKLGLPNYSSHSYVVSVRVELQIIGQVPEESSKLYKMLQEAVDKEIEAVGFLPDATKYGMHNGGQTNGEPQRNEPSGISEIAAWPATHQNGRRHADSGGWRTVSTASSAGRETRSSGPIDSMNRRFPASVPGTSRQGRTDVLVARTFSAAGAPARGRPGGSAHSSRPRPWAGQ